MKSKLVIFGVIILSVGLAGCSSPIDRTESLTELSFADSYGESLLLVKKDGVDSSTYEKAHQELVVTYENADSLSDDDFLKNTERVLAEEAKARDEYVTALVAQIEGEKVASDAEIAKKKAEGWTQLSPTPCTDETVENLKERAMNSVNPDELLSINCTIGGWIKESDSSDGDRF